MVVRHRLGDRYTAFAAMHGFQWLQQAIHVCQQPVENVMHKILKELKGQMVRIDTSASTLNGVIEKIDLEEDIVVLRPIKKARGPDVCINAYIKIKAIEAVTHLAGTEEE